MKKPALKSRPFKFVAAGGLILLLGLMIFVSETGEYHFKSKTVVLNDQKFKLNIADTPAKRQQGLSGRNQLEPYQGMLFVFDDNNSQCIWMKDMTFSLDIIWLDEQRKITDIKKDISPETYPGSLCVNGKYVVEVNAGTADNINLQIGQDLSI